MQRIRMERCLRTKLINVDALFARKLIVFIPKNTKEKENNNLWDCSVNGSHTRLLIYEMEVRLFPVPPNFLETKEIK